MYDMFIILKKMVKLYPAYDSNIYPDGLYLSNGINKNIKQIRKLDEKLSIILPFDKKDYIYCFSIAYINF